MEASTAPEETRREDGRTVRGRRTQGAVVDAVLELVEEGNIRPTAEQVAMRAGVSLRTVYQHFRDREALFQSASQVQLERISPRLRVLPTEGPFGERLSAFLDQRVWLLEVATPLRRAALLEEPFSDVAQQQLTWARDLKRTETMRVFAIELEGVPESERDEVGAALGAATAWVTWEALRAHQGLSVDAARAAMRRMIAAILREPA